MQPWMSDNDKFTILKYLNQDDVMLEWGAGGSTLCFPQFVKEYYSIEHDKDWYNQILHEPTIAYNFTIFLCEPNALRTLPTQKHQFEDYINYISKIDKKFDKILIDGRARQWCAEKALNYLTEDGIVFIHDWIRERYHTILEWYTVIEETQADQYDANGLAVLQKKC